MNVRSLGVERLALQMMMTAHMNQLHAETMQLQSISDIKQKLLLDIEKLKHSEARGQMRLDTLKTTTQTLTRDVNTLKDPPSASDFSQNQAMASLWRHLDNKDLDAVAGYVFRNQRMTAQQH